MKRFVVGLLFMLSAKAYGYGMAGCGLGSQIFKEDNMVQILAVTTNQSSGNQTSGISSGTSGCNANSSAAIISRQHDFVQNNINELYQDFAQGEGETLKAFSEVLGCDAGVVPTVGKTAQSSFDDIFAQPGSVAVLNKAKAVLKADASINSRCKYLI